MGLGIRHLSMLNKALLGEWILKVCNRKRVPIKVNHNCEVWRGGKGLVCEGSNEV